MHEFAVVSTLLETVLGLAEGQGATEVLEVHLRVGKLRALPVEEMKQVYNLLAKGTMLESSTLIVEETGAVVHCPRCGYGPSLEVKSQGEDYSAILQLLCPRCGSVLDIQGGDECVITRIRMRISSAEGLEEKMAVTLHPII